MNKLTIVLLSICVIIFWIERKRKKKENMLVVPQKFDLFYATSFADLEANPTKIVRAFDWEFKLGQRVITYPIDKSPNL